MICPHCQWTHDHYHEGDPLPSWAVKNCDASLNDGAIITAMTNTTTPERAHDERLLELFRDLAKVEQKLGWATASYRNRSHGDRYVRNDRRTLAEVAADMQARRDEAREFWTARGDDPADVEHMTAYAISELDKVENDYTEAVDAMLAAGRAMHAHEESYTGWQRFWLVTSSAGLVHASMNCSTCNKGHSATTFALLPSLSGQPVDALVEAFGPVLCSVCFPAAPTSWVDGERIPARIAQVLLDNGVEAFEAELATFKNKRAARAAKKAATA